MRKDIQTVECSNCGCHFTEDFNVTLSEPCTFWVRMGLTTLPITVKKRLWDWLFSMPADDIANGYGFFLSFNLMADPYNENGYENLFPGFTGLPTAQQHHIVREFCRSDNRPAFVQTYKDSHNAFKDKFIEDAVRLSKLN